MVTYIDAKNALKYQILFEKAVNALQTHPSDEIPQEERETLSITSLDDYYAYLPYLMKFPLLETEDEDVHNFFAKIPLDEEYFKIDANTRNITVPSSFLRNGVGVQGDEIAEVVYFSIDRYFDSVDLASVDNIVIQWRTRNGTGISQHFGKSIEVIDGKEKIVFGWPISSALTGVAGTIQFAVRFYTVDTVNQIIKYSLATLPAEIVINPTLDYDLFDTTIREPSQSDLITSRIKSAGVYNPELPVPEAPIITVPLHVDRLPTTARIVDLPVDSVTGELGNLKLVIGAQPSTIGTIGYEWKQFAYDNGDYANEASGYTGEIAIDYQPVTELNEGKICYTISRNPETGIIAATVVEDLSSLEKNENDVYCTPNGTIVYERISTAIVNNVGIYTVNVTARNKVNTTSTRMPAADGIKIPGPETPVIEFTENELVTDNVAHIISNNNAAAVLQTVVRAGEFDAEGNVLEGMGDNPDVKLSYVWKQVLDDDAIIPVSADAVAGSIEAHILPAAQVPQDENEDDAAFNQSHVALIQDGNDIVIYKIGTEELHEFESLNEYSNTLYGSTGWILVDIDTGFNTIIGHRWGNKPENEQYVFTQDDVDQAERWGLGAGHIAFETNTTALAEMVQIKVDDTILSLTYSAVAPAEVNYAFSADRKTMTITGLEDADLDKTYIVEVQAVRNGIETRKSSGQYRITNSPIAPSVQIKNSSTGEWETAVFNAEDPAIPGIYRKTTLGNANSLAFLPSVEKTDNTFYLWMYSDIDDEIELANNIILNLNTLFPSDAASFNIEEIPQSIGSLVSSDNSPTFNLNASSPNGYYYCLIVNQLNGHQSVSLTPFFNVRG